MHSPDMDIDKTTPEMSAAATPLSARPLINGSDLLLKPLWHPSGTVDPRVNLLA